MADSPQRHLLRFLKKPSVFQILDDPLAEKTRLESIALGEADLGKLSFWEVDDAQSERFVVAAFAACRARKDRIDVLRLPLELFLELEIKIGIEPDPRTFECIRERHRALELASKSKRLELAEAVWNYLSSSGAGEGKTYYRVKRGEIEEVLQNAYRECRDFSGQIEKELVSDWAREIN